MSYDIELKNKVTGETAKMRHPQYVRGGTVRAVVDERTGQLVQAEQTEADINITLTEHRALLKPNTESAACMERLLLNQFRC